ncbi:MAG TPA: hypothetical protein VJS66_05125 [Burkholderiales bacterium]|nr:hypothetical protein [Burkholderiales bacterium]
MTLSLALAVCAMPYVAAADPPLACAEKLALAALPRDVFHLPASEAMQLNLALEQHGAVRLDPHANYARAFRIHLKSNQALYGLAGTKVPEIVIAGGSENVIVSDVQTPSLTFPPSELVTSRNCFNRVRSSIEMKNARIERNLFTDFQGGIIAIDNSARGYLRDNRFIKTMTHTAWPALTIRGNAIEPSYGNHFVWTNILGPLGDGIVVDRQRDIAFTGLDIESWSWASVAKQNVPIRYPAAINVSNTEFLSVFMSHGGNHRIKAARYFGLDAQNILLLGSDVERQSLPGLVLGKQVKRLLAIGTSDIGHRTDGAGTEVIELLRDGVPQVRHNWQVKPSTRLPAAALAGMQDILRRERRIYEGWGKPTFAPMPDLAASGGGLKIHKDASKTIQTLVERQGIARLDAGVYYLSKPIELKDGQGIVGAGQDKTFLVAQDANLDMIVGANRIDDRLASTWFVLADVTLQGGRNGVHHDAAGSGNGALYHRSVISHVTFRGMHNAAILLDGIDGWDNNFLDNVNFVECGSAIMQRPDPRYRGGDVPGMTYMDKNVCYRCRFERNAVALDMPGKRGNGLNAFIDSEFRSNGKAVRAIHPLANFFANSTFIDNRGNPSIETNKDLGFVHTDFVQTVPGSIFQRHVLCNGCEFSVGHPQASIVGGSGNPKPGPGIFVNSNVDTSLSGQMRAGLILGDSNPTDLGRPVFHLVGEAAR